MAFALVPSGLVPVGVVEVGEVAGLAVEFAKVLGVYFEAGLVG